MPEIFKVPSFKLLQLLIDATCELNAQTPPAYTKVQTFENVIFTDDLQESIAELFLATTPAIYLTPDESSVVIEPETSHFEIVPLFSTTRPAILFTVTPLISTTTFKFSNFDELEMLLNKATQSFVKPELPVTFNVIV